VADGKSWAGLPRKTLKFALPAVVALGAGSAIAVAAIPSADGTIHACYSTSTGPGAGALRVIDESDACTASENAISWNQQGPQGNPGPQGPKGDKGDQGNKGDEGDDATTPVTAPTSQAFLLLDGIPGGSTAPGHEKQVEVQSFSFGLSNTNPPNSSARGTGRGKFQNLHFTKLHDRSSAKLFKMSGTGQHIKSAVFSVFKDGKEVIRYKLADVLVKSYSTKDTPTGNTESIVLVPTRVDLAFNDNGTSLTSSFDTKTNHKPVISNFSFKTQSR
jgi:type VI secretion system Hcp family effector